MEMKIISTPDVVRLNHGAVQTLIRKAVHESTGRKVQPGPGGVMADPEGDHFACCVTLTDDVFPKKETLAEGVMRIFRVLKQDAQARGDLELVASLNAHLNGLYIAGHLTLQQKESV